MIEEPGTVRLQPCKSPVWDTALALRALAAAGGQTQLALERGTQWLLDKEVRCAGDWQKYVTAEPGGWFFEYHNAFYPDVDDTIMVMMAMNETATHLHGASRVPPAGGHVTAAILRARQWILAMQNRDGGWGAFDRDNDRQFLCHVPFADHNAMIDPSTPDITGRVLESLAQLGMSVSDEPVARAVRYLRATQEADGSWYGRWGVNYIYGTWQVLTGWQRPALLATTRRSFEEPNGSSPISSPAAAGASRRNRTSSRRCAARVPRLRRRPPGRCWV